MKTSEDYEQLMIAVRKNPADTTKRQVLADALEDLDELAHAWFIREQCNPEKHLPECELATNPDGRGWWAYNKDRQCPGCQQLLRVARLLDIGWHCNGDGLVMAWRPPKAKPGDWVFATVPPPDNWSPSEATSPGSPRGWCQIREGFVDRVTCTMAIWMRDGPSLWARHPIQYVLIKDREPIRVAARVDTGVAYSLLPGHVDLIPESLREGIIERNTWIFTLGWPRATYTIPRELAEIPDSGGLIFTSALHGSLGKDSIDLPTLRQAYDMLSRCCLIWAEEKSKTTTRKAEGGSPG